VKGKMVVHMGDNLTIALDEEKALARRVIRAADEVTYC
jgi:hypothetical protein